MPLLRRYESLLLKKSVALSQPYSHRMSQSLALKLQLLSSLRWINKFSVLDEIALLENTPTSRPTGTKPAEKFRGPILGRFWHKHYYDSRHLAQNFHNKWFGDYAIKHGLLKEKLHEILMTEVDDSDMEKYRLIMANRISHTVVYDGIESRRKRSALTGEWLIYYIHNDFNYYLDLANHIELEDPKKMFDRLKDACAWEFPFAFEDARPLKQSRTNQD
ncbi:hypothetical protein [Pseudomonas simiae]|uniref:Uncharacterized protein n=1 Tax=Pseudomonas simiae TaxID=321846 RepID=A0ABS9GDT8_9PSED|nr:hypothetical protein [Pseudomonas simiae]MCF5189566.1 hypothetical protein [Pseudomonas simiae]MCF5287836.1 hypothetical protein [Pseudomonas simiae]MCF5321525.1 hypothetical protein [Pseudomonas simiae]MCF5335314.1 hypothetical protein [Pseudomonas simiae]MCF5342740.1 hypothetical protein [Pseudomonas simiae]